FEASPIPFSIASFSVYLRSTAFFKLFASYQLTYHGWNSERPQCSACSICINHSGGVGRNSSYCCSSNACYEHGGFTNGSSKNSRGLWRVGKRSYLVVVGIYFNIWVVSSAIWKSFRSDREKEGFNCIFHLVRALLFGLRIHEEFHCLLRLERISRLRYGYPLSYTVC